MPPQTASAVVSAHEIDMSGNVADPDNVNNPHNRAFTSHIPEEKTGDYALTDQASANLPVTAAIENNQAFLDSSPPRDTN